MTEHVFKFQPHFETDGYLPEHVGRLYFGPHCVRLLFTPDGPMALIPSAMLNDPRHCHVYESSEVTMLGGLGALPSKPLMTETTDGNADGQDSAAGA